jgi:hypothetical protein
MEYFKYIGSMIANDASPAHEIKFETFKAKAAFNKKNTLPTNGTYMKGRN